MSAPACCAGLLRKAVCRNSSLLRHHGKQAFCVAGVAQYRRSLTTSTTVLAGKKLFTPGPLGVSSRTKKAMTRDLGSRDPEFIQLVEYIRETLVKLAGVSTADYTCVPMQGSGTFSIEAFFQTAVPRTGAKVLILENGAYGRRQADICKALDIPHHVESFGEREPVSADRVDQILKDDAFTHVCVVHCETSSGIINPVQEIGQLVKRFNPALIYFVDAMSSFGAIPLKMDKYNIDYLVSSANKCIEGVPGFSYVLAWKAHLLSCQGNSRSVSLDLYDQYMGLEKTGQFRFTPPTHAMLAFRHALQELQQEGGVAGRAKRYYENREILRTGMRAMGFREFLRDEDSGYIITSYLFPDDPNFNFSQFYQKLYDKDQVIYPGKLMKEDCFRLGNIGHLHARDMIHLLECIGEVCDEMKIKLPVSYSTETTE